MTNELLIRPWRLGDAPRLHRAVLESVDHLRPWVPFAAREPITLAERRANILKWRIWWDSGGDRLFGLFCGRDVVGGCGLHRRIGPGGVEIGYWVHPRFVRRGFATAAARRMTDEGLALDGVDRVEIWHKEANAPSGRIPATLGFSLAGVKCRDGVPGEEWMVWRMTRDAWRSA